MKRFISGFLLGALIFAVPAIANNAKTIEAFYNNIKLSVYGQIVDTEGNDPFIVNGRTYVPARYVAEAMGGVVKWNETENTVEVTHQTPETTATPDPTKLTSDGLEAIYSYNQQKYIVKSSLIWDKYHISRTLSPDNKTLIIYKENNRTTNISVANCVINGIAGISYDDYENKVLPFIQGLN